MPRAGRALSGVAGWRRWDSRVAVRVRRCFEDERGPGPRARYLDRLSGRAQRGIRRTLGLEESVEVEDAKDMDAARIIEAIQRLPEEERGKVLEFVRNQPNSETLEAMREPVDALPRFDTVEELFKELRD